MTGPLMRSKALLSRIALLLCGVACSGLLCGKDEPRPPAEKPPVAASVPSASTAGAPPIELLKRVEDFYDLLEGRKVSSRGTYRNEAIRSYFADEAAYGAYIAFMNLKLRRARFRATLIRKIDVEKIEVTEGGARAKVSITLRGDHVQPFFFWDNVTTLDQIWERVEGVWFLYPPPF